MIDSEKKDLSEFLPYQNLHTGELVKNYNSRNPGQGDILKSINKLGIVDIKPYGTLLNKTFDQG